jgi:hypothetical protein
METGEAEITTFAQSHVLMDMFGSEESFNAMAADEVKALATSDGVIDFLTDKMTELGKDAGGSALKWASAQLLRAVGLGSGQSELQRIAAMLETILKQQELILAQLKALQEEVKYQRVIGAADDAIAPISTIGRHLRVLSGPGDPSGREAQAAVVRAAILNVSDGAVASLNSFSNVLLGRDRSTDDPLIRLFSKRWQSLFLGMQLRPDVPLSDYERKLEQWLHAQFIVQYRGLTQLANARIADGAFALLEREIAEAVRDMIAQRAMLNEAIPAWTRTLPASVTDGRRYLVRGPHMHAGRWDTSHVLHGVRNRMLRFLNAEERRRVPNYDGPNAEEWLFQKSGPNDAFVLRQASQDQFVATDRGKVELRPFSAVLRLVMAPTNGRPGWGSEPFAPALGLVGGDRYLYWRREGDVLAGRLDQASIVEIVPVRP